MVEKELEKVKNQTESSHVFSKMELLNKAYSLAYFTMLKDTSLVNNEINKIRKVEYKQKYKKYDTIKNISNENVG